MTEGLLLIEGKKLSPEMLDISLGNAKQLVIGRVPRGGIVLHLAATSATYFGNAILEFSQIPGVTKVLTLAIENH